jgi:calcineurin-like phosphoesterase family protein
MRGNPLRLPSAAGRASFPWMALFFTSDTHFGQGSALGFFQRPFRSAAEMDEALIAGWNAALGRDDEVWHLGDFAIRQSPERMTALLERLHGRKHLVLGNNDPPATAGLPFWASVAERRELDVDGIFLILTHHPLAAVPDGSVNLHGHSHGRRKPRPRQIDVGVDCWGLRPVAWAYLAERLGAAEPARP